jgi:glycosyltransferase involved in cell wall biosynthesis
MRILRISHSAVVSSWRERERLLIGKGLEVRLISAERWNEGGAIVAFQADSDEFVSAISTLGKHPNLFIFNPIGLWKYFRMDRKWHIVDIHEEPCSLAAFEVWLIMKISRIRAPFLLYSAQNILKLYPVPFRMIERLLLKRCSAVHTCNDGAAEIVKLKGLRGVAKTIPLGVNINSFSALHRSAPVSPFKVGFVGRLERHKGVHVLIEAVAPDNRLQLEIVGAGPEEDNLRKQVERANIGARVKFLGYHSNADLPNIYRGWDVVVVPSLPSRRWLEQFCRVAVEAMASGVPVVASDSGALPEVIGSAGLLVPPGDPIALRSALLELLEQPGLWQELREAGLQRSHAYSWEAVADKYHELYQEVAAGSHVD